MFYQLPDENDSDSTARGTDSDTHATLTDANLRPDVKGYKYTIKSLPWGEREEDNNNDIPLHGIRVEKAFETSKNRNERDMQQSDT